MHLKFRRDRALLYRSQWVPKGTDANTHGFSRQTYVGSLTLDAQSISDALKQRLTDAEADFVEAKVCSPAREAAQRQRREVERRERDPEWRLDEATRLVDEAVERSAEQPITAVTVAAVRDAVGRLRVTGNPQATEPAMTFDPLAEALTAVRAAAEAVASGRYGKAPAEGVRNTQPYRLWSELFGIVQGESEGSLLRALQAKGFVKKRGG